MQNISWQDGQPFSDTFGDVYFSRDSGLEETWHVFLRQNQLPERFAALAAHQHFTIGETGFGTGLNFLCAWQCFQQYAPVGARLHYISVEKFPLTPRDLTQALALWPELAPLAQVFCAQYCALPNGWHRMLFDQGRIVLTLIIGDAVESLEALDAYVDAWFLDGFSPAKNPEMWNPRLFNAMALHSEPGATLATFTSAGFVRRGLQDAGFQVERVPGFGSKRQMSRGVLPTPVSERPWSAPWFAKPSTAPRQEKTAIVIGGGISGAASAYSLALRGWSVTLIERHAQLASEASGNPQGILYARLSAHAPPLSQLTLSGYLYTVGLLRRLLPQSDETWRNCGLLQLAQDQDEFDKQQALLASGIAGDLIQALNPTDASACAGVELTHGGLFFPQGGWLYPAALVAKLCAQPGIQLKTSTTALELDYNPEHRHWIALGEQGPIAVGSVVILAGGADSTAFDATQHLPVKRIRGQISQAPATAASQKLKTVLCGAGYIAPARAGLHCLGASFKFNADHLDISAQEHGENLEMLDQAAPSLYRALGAASLDTQQMKGRAAYRTTSPDYMPIVGPVAHHQAFMESYRDLTRDASLQLTAPTPWVPGLYINAAHGSRGMVSAPISGEILAAYINNAPAPLAKPLMDTMHPNRFWVRELSRGKRDRRY